MTRLAILSDIHGNFPALEAVIKDMESFEPDHVIVAGDSINGAPFDVQIMECIVNRGWTAIRGNHEFYLLDYGTPREREHMRHSRSATWLNETLKDWFAYIAAMPDELTLYYRDGPPVYITHGLPGNPDNAIMRVTSDEQIASWLNGVEQSIFISGHYHLSVERHVDRWHILNPGPVGALMDGTRDASYLLIEAAGDCWHATFRHVPYDFTLVDAAFKQQKLLDLLGLEGLLKFEQLRRARPTIQPFKRWMQAHYPNEGRSFPRAYEYLSLPLEAVWDTLGKGYLVNPDLPLPPADFPDG